jgi:serine/threonine protein kinase
MNVACPKCKIECGADLQICPNCGVDLVAEETAANLELSGSVLDGKYRLEDKIGAGSMGAIFRAHHLSLDKIVCVKVMHPHVAADPKLVRRFHREARAASSLQHPNIISVMDFGQASIERPDGADTKLLYLVMEYVEGVDLSDRLKMVAHFEISVALSVAQQIAEALDEAHTKGVVHRDLKPENIMVFATRQAEIGIKVLDFGIAKILDQGQERGLTRLTMAGTVCGTPEYMSPEQARGKDLDGRTDLYALGVMLYQLLTGTLPFDGDSAIEIVTLHLTEQPVRPRHINPEIPEEVESLVLRLMNKRADGRPTNALDVAKECETLRLGIESGSIQIPEGGTGTRAMPRRFIGETRLDPDSPLSRAETNPDEDGDLGGRKRRYRKTTTDALDRTARLRPDSRSQLPWILLLTAISLGTAAVYALNRDVPRPMVPLEAIYPPNQNPTEDRTATVAKSDERTRSDIRESADARIASSAVPVTKDISKLEDKKIATRTGESASRPDETPRGTKAKQPARKKKPVVTKRKAKKPTRAEQKSAAAELEKKARARSNLREAIKLYKKAYRTYPKPRLQYEIGMCYLQEGAMNQARKHMDLYLRKLSPARREKEKPKVDLMLAR